jgi:hypothetical protein
MVVSVGVSVEVDVLTGDSVGVLVGEGPIPVAVGVGVLVREDAVPVFVGVVVMVTVPLETTIFTKTDSPKNVPTAFCILQ